MNIENFLKQQLEEATSHSLNPYFKEYQERGLNELKFIGNNFLDIKNLLVNFEYEVRKNMNLKICEDSIKLFTHIKEKHNLDLTEEFKNFLMLKFEDNGT